MSAAASRTFQELAARSGRELETVLQRGSTPSLDALLGYEFRGYNRPARTALLGIRKFIKGFFPATGEVFGFNTPARQNGLEGDWTARPDDDHPRRYAFFRVSPAEARPRDDRYPRALLLDYGAGRNRGYDPARLLRDYVVRVDANSDDLLLGKAYVALGPARVAVGFFLLERHRPFTSDPALERRVRD